MIFDTFQYIIDHNPRMAIDIIELVKWVNGMSTETYHPQINFILPKVLHIIEEKRQNSEMTVGS